MADLAKAEIEALARLCRLDLSAAQVENFAHELSRIVAHIETLSQVDVAGVEPFIAPELPALDLRPDLAEPPLARDEALAPVPEHDGQFVLVPRFKDEG